MVTSNQQTKGNKHMSKFSKLLSVKESAAKQIRELSSKKVAAEILLKARSYELEVCVKNQSKWTQGTIDMEYKALLELQQAQLVSMISNLQEQIEAAARSLETA